MNAAATKHVDYILVGQGLAGTLLAHQLESKGYSFVIFDQERRDSSSRLAAGVMNPITGRRFVKSWMYDTLLPKAIATYTQLEQRLSCDLIKSVNILRVFPDHRMENDWIARSGFTDYEKYMVDQPDLDTFKQFDKNWKFGEVRGSYQVDVPQLLAASRERWVELGWLHECVFDHRNLDVAGPISYKDINASHIVFCEGERLRLNPLFQQRLLDVSRGDVLIVRIPNFTATKMIKKKYFLIHQENDRFWFGAKNSWDVHDTLPKTAFKEDLIKALEHLIDVPYEIEDYKAAVRPTVQDRRPILGKHPEHPDVYVLNGLGTKGTSLGPYWVDQLLAFISSKRPLPPEVDLSRFYG